MKYQDLLRHYISKSGLSLSEISDKLKDKGFSTHKGHISKLQNGKLPPASEKMNRSLAEITGGDPEELIRAAYKEKAPDEIKSLFGYFESIEDAIEEAILGFQPIINDSDEALVQELILQLQAKDIWLPEDFSEQIKSPDSFEIFVSGFNFEEKSRIFSTLVKLTRNKMQKIEKLKTDELMDELPPEAQKAVEDFKKFIYEKYMGFDKNNKS